MNFLAELRRRNVIRLAEPHAVIVSTLDNEFRFTEARAEFEKALAIDPMDVTSNLWFALGLSRTGYERARAARLERVLELDPLMPNALNLETVVGRIRVCFFWASQRDVTTQHTHCLRG